MKIYGKKVKVKFKVKSVEFGEKHTVSISRGKRKVKFSYTLPRVATKKELLDMIILQLGIFLVSKNIREFGIMFHKEKYLLKSVKVDYLIAKNIINLVA